MNDDVIIKHGKILVYRVFDIASEIDLEKVIQLLQEKQNASRFKLDRNYKMSLVIPTAPVSVALGSVELSILDKNVSIEIEARVWHFGGLSLVFHIPIETGTNWTQLISIAQWIEKDQEIDLIARTKARFFQEQIKDSMQTLNEWSTFEDYVTFFIKEISGISEGAMNLTELVDIPALILAEPSLNLSTQMRKLVMENCLQYGNDDLSVIDWNSALLVEPSGSMDVPIVIEFALCQLLEMRYYDDLLDEKLNNLYNSVANKKSSILSNKYSVIAEEAGQIYLEIAEIVETVENSLKVVGDFYLANIFRAASGRFRFKDWQRSINEKLSNLAEVSKLLHGRVAEQRSQMMELTIILLIAVELIPFIKALFVSYQK
jgi:hypothetical protein